MYIFWQDFGHVKIGLSTHNWMYVRKKNFHVSCTWYKSLAPDWLHSWVQGLETHRNCKLSHLYITLDQYWSWLYNLIYALSQLKNAWSLMHRYLSAAHTGIFSPKFLSLHYFTTLEGIFGVQRGIQAQGNVIDLFGLLLFKVYSNFAGKQQTKPTKWT